MKDDLPSSDPIDLCQLWQSVGKNQEYEIKLLHMFHSSEKFADLKRLNKELLDLLEKEEDSELTGRPFRPNTIRSCRVLDGEKIDNILIEIKKIVGS